MTILRDIEIYRTALAFTQPMQFAQYRLEQREVAFVKAFNLQLNTEVVAELAPLPGFSRETLVDAMTEIQLAAQSQARPYRFRHPSSAFAWDCLLHGITPTEIAPDIPLLQGSVAAITSQYQALQLPSQIKLKVARLDPAEEIALIYALIALNPRLRMRLDANQGWNQEQAMAFARQLSGHHVEYIEEPCANLTDSLTMARTYQLPIALDEHLQQSDWPLDQFNDPIIHAFVIKPMLIGSFQRIAQLLALAQQQQKRAIISCAFESPYGLGVLAHLAKQWTPNELAGLDTAKYFSSSDLDPPNELNMERIWSSK